MKLYNKILFILSVLNKTSTNHTENTLITTRVPGYFSLFQLFRGLFIN